MFDRGIGVKTPVKVSQRERDHNLSLPWASQSPEQRNWQEETTPLEISWISAEIQEISPGVAAAPLVPLGFGWPMVGTVDGLAPDHSGSSVIWLIHTSCRSESSNFSLVVLDKLTVSA